MAAKRSSEMRPFITPSENRIGRRVSTPGMPLGMLRNVLRAPAASLPAGSLNRNGQWSDENRSKSPCSIPAQIFGHSSELRGGGEQTYFAPSNPSRSKSCAVRVIYCGQVSAKTFMPRWRPRTISSVASPLDTCTMVSGTPAISANEIARWVASRSTGTGRVVAW